MKNLILIPAETWITDRFGLEFVMFNDNYRVWYNNFTPTDPVDIQWWMAEWAWTQTIGKIKARKTVCSLHHYVPSKFNKEEFIYRDQFVDLYHIACRQTYEFVKPYIGDKPYFIQPFWINEILWKQVPKDGLREKYNIPQDAFVILSAVRDSEGTDLNKPKIEKGPVELADYIIARHQRGENIFLILGAWRRNYILNRLDAAGFPKEKILYNYPNTVQDIISFETLNDYYNIADLCVCSSHFEGGPQFLFEASLIKCPVISTPMGGAEYLLAPESISKEFSAASLLECKPNVDYAFQQVQKYKMLDIGMDKFKYEFEKL